jgi:hypothetical protein
VLGLRRDRDHAQVVGEQHDTRTVVVGSNGSTAQQHRLAQRVSDVRAESGEKSGFRGCETQPVLSAVQAQVAPALRADDQRRPKLIAEAQGRMMSRYRPLERRSRPVALSSAATCLAEAASEPGLPILSGH